MPVEGERGGAAPRPRLERAGPAQMFSPAQIFALIVQETLRILRATTIAHAHLVNLRSVTQATSTVVFCLVAPPDFQPESSFLLNSGPLCKGKRFGPTVLPLNDALFGNVLNILKLLRLPTRSQRRGPLL